MKIFNHLSLFVIALSLGLSQAHAAPDFAPGSQPLGYIAPVAVNTDDANADAIAYLPKFDMNALTGDVVAANFLSNGAIDLLHPIWSFSDQVTGVNWNSGRRIVTMHQDNYVVPFRKDFMDGDQVNMFDKDREDRIDYLRGDRSKEGDKFRTRDSVVGHIVHSNPVYVGPPNKGYNFNNYDAFASDFENREGRVYVGSNSGMLHAINAVTGHEEFAFVPTPVFERMNEYSKEDYGLGYAVDGPITVEDARFSSAWHSILVGGLGGGGQGIYALDVTFADSVINETNAAGGAGQHVMWEFTRASNNSNNLGYTYSRTSIVRLNTGQWAAVFGNGYMSDSGRASLYVLDISNGSVIREIVVPDTNNNGLSSPVLVDIDGDLDVDIAYAGDLNGNVWKFDLSSTAPVSWGLTYGVEPVFVARAADGTRQSITSAVDVGVHSAGGFMVYAATGRLFSETDSTDDTEQAIYGVHDYNLTPANLPLTNANFVGQTITEHTHPSRLDAVRTASSNTVNWGTQNGWRLSLAPTNGAAGERVIQDIQLRNNRIAVSSMNPNGNGANWLMEINSQTGGAPDVIVFDINRDGDFSVADNVDGDGNSAVTETPVDRIMGLYKGTGLASRTTLSQANDASASVITNQIIGIPPTYTVTTPPGEPGTDDYGLAGGHMDLDVSSRTYPIGNGETDKHDHEWDNEYGNIVDFFEIDNQGGFRAVDSNSDVPGSSTSAKFIINIVNAGLSPGGILEINGVDFPVRVWQAKVRRYLTGTQESGEWFPVFKLAPPTATEDAHGVLQLTSLKMKFFADTILVGGLHPTKTGCVKGNDPGVNGEYRNGALTTQLLDASGVAPSTGTGAYTPTHDASRNAYEGSSFAIHDALFYAMPPSGKSYGTSDGLFWESTLFWHWGGGCYTADNTADYTDAWADEVGGTDTRVHDDPPGTGNFSDPFVDGSDPTPPGDTTTTETSTGSSDSSASNDNISLGVKNGRLFWREWIPDND